MATTSRMNSPLLEVRGISKRFRGLKAVTQVSLSVATGHIVALIGPNGAGKTTTFNMIAGVYRPDEGEILLDGQPIHGRRPDEICLAGVGRTFQLVKPFAGLSVLDNVVIGALRRHPDVATARRKSLAILERLGIGEKSGLQASSLRLSSESVPTTTTSPLVRARRLPPRFPPAELAVPLPSLTWASHCHDG